MGSKTVILVAVLSGFIAYRIHRAFEPPPLPTLDENKWWGPGEPKQVDESIRPFNVNVSREVLDDLYLRLSGHRQFTETLEGVQQQYGVHRQLIEKFVKYWAKAYKWKNREPYVNKYPQFKTNIQGLDIHFLHVKPENPGTKKVLPILLLHGWPGSVLEFYEMIPYLTKTDESVDFVFEVVVPSIPGYGFSQGASKPGLGASAMTVILKHLMERLGLPKFYAQGGDFGAIILQNMAVLYPNSFLGYHSNLCIINTPGSYIKTLLGSIYPKWIIPNEDHIRRLYPLKESAESKIRESGYLHLQATKPDTIGIALNESPTGLAAYILEKFTSGTNITWQQDIYGGLPGPYSMDALIDNLMYYWIPGSITTAVRLYAETFNSAEYSKKILWNPISVPTACARFSNEIQYPAEGYVHDIFKNLVQLTDHYGGHFAAMQYPEVLAKDVISAVQKIEKLRV